MVCITKGGSSRVQRETLKGSMLTKEHQQTIHMKFFLMVYVVYEMQLGIMARSPLTMSRGGFVFVVIGHC